MDEDQRAECVKNSDQAMGMARSNKHTDVEMFTQAG